MNKLTIGYLYKKHLNLYGDNGNIEVLVQRALRRGFEVEVLEIEQDTLVSSDLFKNVNLVFMGGGPDSGQRDVYEDLVKNKGDFLKEYIGNGGVGLYICGAYQLLGHFYEAADGSRLDGLGVFDLYTEHFGKKIPRCIGNTVAKFSRRILEDPVFKSINSLDDFIVGFENHGGRTFLKQKEESFASMVRGSGNNSKDKTEGCLFNNSIGTYFHGPILSKNPHLADYLIAKSLGIDSLQKLDDSLIIATHTASMKLKQ